jgi:hypothetical protein
MDAAHAAAEDPGGGAARVSCRICGSWGYETPDDPCPGVCPVCFEEALVGTLAVSFEERHRRGLTVHACMERQRERLRAMGLAPAAEQRFARRAAALLADVLAAERRGS